MVTRKSLENAARVVACTGGSTNGGLHLPAIAHEAGIEFTLQDVCDIFRDTPYFVDLKPGGKYVAKDLFEAGGVPVVLKELRAAGLPARRMHDRQRPDHRRGARRHPRRGGRPGDLPGRHADHRRPAASSA